MIRFTETGDGHTASLVGATVTQVSLDHRLTWTIMDADLERLVIGVSAPFCLTGPESGELRHVEPELPTPQLGIAVVQTRLATVERCIIVDGTLHVAFGSGIEVCVAASGRYEAWELEVLDAGTYRFKAVCAPGGEVVLW